MFQGQTTTGVINMKFLISFLSVLLISTQVLAQNTDIELTVKGLIANGYHKMSGDEIQKQLLNKKLVLIDLDAKSQYEAILLTSGKTKKKKTVKEHPSTLTDAKFQGRAPILKGPVEYSVKGDAIVTTDGIRTHISTLYKKDDDILGIRDVDNGQVNFRITIKSEK